MSEPAEISLTRDDLYASALDERIQVDRSLEDMARASRSIIRTPVLRSPMFQYPFAGLTGAIGGFLANEYLVDQTPVARIASLPTATLYMLTGGGIGLMMGLLFGVIHRNPRHAVRCALMGLLAGLFTPVVTGGMAELAMWVLVDLPRSLSRGSTGIPKLDTMHGIGFFLFVAASGLSWGLVCLATALGPGLGLKSAAIKYNGWVGGAVGGVIGGIMLGLLTRMLLTTNLSPTVRSAIVVSQVGIWVGIGFASMEFSTREAWFVLAKGWLRGKRILFHKDHLALGCSTRSDIYLTGDPAIEASHALLTREGVRWLLRDNETEAGTFVNGHRIRQCLLNSGDVVTIGQTVLKFIQRKHLS